MSAFERNKINSWARLAANIGLLVSDRKLRKAIGNQVRSRVDRVAETLSDRYDDAVDRLESAADALNGRSHWGPRVTSLILGIGVGAGLGILLAPAAGGETRHTLRNKAVDLKNRAAESAAAATRRMHPSASNLPQTGTEA